MNIPQFMAHPNIVSTQHGSFTVPSMDHLQYSHGEGHVWTIQHGEGHVWIRCSLQEFRANYLESYSHVRIFDLGR